MVLMRLIYVAQPLGYDPLELDDILHASRAHNGRDGITELLVTRWDLFVQLLEGPAEAMAATFERIRRDRRHVAVTLLGTAEAGQRLFPDWQMREQAAPSWVWSHADVLARRHMAAPFDEVMAMFERIAAGPSTTPDSLP